MQLPPNPSTLLVCQKLLAFSPVEFCFLPIFVQDMCNFRNAMGQIIDYHRHSISNLIGIPLDISLKILLGNFDMVNKVNLQPSVPGFRFCTGSHASRSLFDSVLFSDVFKTSPTETPWIQLCCFFSLVMIYLSISHSASGRCIKLWWDYT